MTSKSALHQDRVASAPTSNHFRAPTQNTSEFTRYPVEINEDEKIWQDRYSFFLDRGFMLRPRYRPGWTPSWIGTGKHPSQCEDAIEQILPMVLDAKRGNDGSIVCIKLIQERTNEVDVARYLSDERLLHDPKNHSVPILDSFQDPFLPQVDFIVMPVLRPFDDPDFWVVGEVVDFVTQLLEGLDFMHQHFVAHGDLTGVNIMMDGRPLFPRGWHFVADHYTPDNLTYLTPLARIDHPVRYYIIDYDCAIKFRPGQSPLISEFGGRDDDVPEFSTYKPYDAFKVDIFTLGNVFFRELYQKYLGLDFLTSLTSIMMTRDPRERATAHAALMHWYKVRDDLDVTMARWRLRKRNETVSERVVLDAVAAAHQGIHSVKRLFTGSSKRTWRNP